MNRLLVALLGFNALFLASTLLLQWRWHLPDAEEASEFAAAEDHGGWHASVSNDNVNRHPGCLQLRWLPHESSTTRQVFDMRGACSTESLISADMRSLHIFPQVRRGSRLWGTAKPLQMSYSAWADAAAAGFSNEGVSDDLDAVQHLRDVFQARANLTALQQVSTS